MRSKPVVASHDFDDDEWQAMPVETSHSSTSSIQINDYSNRFDVGYQDEQDDDSDPDDARGFDSVRTSNSYMRKQCNKTHHKRSKPKSQYLVRNGANGSKPNSSRSHNAATNATGKHLDIYDARGYDWRSKPITKNKFKQGDVNHDDNQHANHDDDAEKGYTQLRLDEDQDAEQLDIATQYLFQDTNHHNQNVENTTATPLNQMNTTKQLLSEAHKIAYVGLCSLLASEMVRQLGRVPGSNLDAARASMEGWKLKVMARLYQHMEIECSEQRMIESLAEHGVLATDLAPSLITTQTIDNPDFDAQALTQMQEHHQQQSEQQPQVEDDHADIRANLNKPTTEYVETVAEKQNTLKPNQHNTHAWMDDEGFDIGMQLQHSHHPTDSASRDQSVEVGSHAVGASNVCACSCDDESKCTRACHVDQVVGESNCSPCISTVSTRTLIVDANTASRMSNGVDWMHANLNQAHAQVGVGCVSTTLALTKQPQRVEVPPGGLEAVTTSISSTDATITLDLRWTILCDLFLVLTADSVYDARSRVLLERVASYLGLSWMDVTQFETRVTQALEIEEGVETLSDESTVKQRMLMARNKRLVMMGLATVGGGLVIGLSAGLLAPVIGAGMGAALGAVGIGGTSSFLGGVGGAALITSTGTVGGMGLAGRGMSRRTRSVKTFEFKPIHNNKRVNAIVTVPGFMSGAHDDVRLPFSVIDSVMGDVFSVLWEPDMMQEMGNALGLLWNETIVQGVQQALALTVAGASAMLSALAWPLWLTKLGYLIDNPWSNALDRAQAAGLILADTLAKRQLGVRPITLVGYSLGARVIFYALVELSRIKAYGIVQNVYIMGAPITAKDDTWKEARSVVSGRFVSAFSRTDWILGYLHRAASGGIRSIAGLHPVERVQDIENVDVTHVVPGHLGYRPLMPLVLGELGFRTTADYFDEPEDVSAIPERQVVPEQDANQLELKTVCTKTGGFGKIFARNPTTNQTRRSVTPMRWSSTTTTATSTSTSTSKYAEYDEYEDDDDDHDVPPRIQHHDKHVECPPGGAETPEADRRMSTSAHFDTETLLRELRESGIEVKELKSCLPPLPLATDSKHGLERVSSPTMEVTPPQASNGGVSLTFGSYDDDDEEEEIQAGGDVGESESWVNAARASEMVVGRYALCSSAAQGLADGSRNGDTRRMELGGSTAALQDQVWTMGEEGWGLSRPDTSYDVWMGTKNRMQMRSMATMSTMPTSMNTRTRFGMGDARSSGQERSVDALTPPSLAVGRGIDICTTPHRSCSGERTPRGTGDNKLVSDPDAWAENPW